jgi:hypothetical protein
MKGVLIKNTEGNGSRLRARGAPQRERYTFSRVDRIGKNSGGRKMSRLVAETTQA